MASLGNLAPHPLTPGEMAAVAAMPLRDDRDARRIVAPIPSELRPTKATFARFTPRGMTFTEAYVWRTETGEASHYTARFDGVGVKAVLPFCLVEGAGGLEWVAKAPPGKRAPYNLDRLAANPTAPVIITEGERTANAVSAIFPGHVVTTSMGGAKAAAKTDWSALHGRDASVWPDNDKAGHEYKDDVVSLVTTVGAASVRVVHLPDGLPSGWDPADPVPAGVDLDFARTLAEAVDATAGAPSAVNSGEEWPAPLPITSTLPPVLPFDPDLLPERLRHYVLDVADRQQAPPDFAAVAALCGLAAVLGNTVKIAPKAHDDWHVTPNLWGAIIGRPSAMKSPAMAAALAPVYALQDEMREQWEAARKEDAINDALAGLDEKEAKKRAAKYLKEGDRDAARSAIISAAGDDDERPPCPRLVINDATVEKAGEMLNENPRGLLLIRDELAGFLARMESEEYQSERAFYLEAFNGDGRFTYDRIGRGTIEIKNCTLSMIGGVQPSRIAPIVRGAITGASNDGLIQRLQMAVWPDDIAEWRWVDRIPKVLERLDFDRAFTDLRAITPGHDGAPTVMRFTPEAQDLFRSWMMEIQTEARGGTLPTTLESHILKMPKTVASLALIFELVEGGRTAVGATATARALDWADYLRSHANRLYAAGATMAEDGARLMIERRAQLPDPFTARDVQRRQWAGLADRDAVASSIEALLATNHVRETSEGAGPHGGRPSVTYQWNPLLKVGG